MDCHVGTGHRNGDGRLQKHVIPKDLHFQSFGSQEILCIIKQLPKYTHEKGIDYVLVGDYYIPMLTLLVQRCTSTALRKFQWIKHPLSTPSARLQIIIIAVTAILCGMDTWNEIEDWACSQKEWLETFLELPGGIPSHDTINRVFQMIDPVQFHDAFFVGQK